MTGDPVVGELKVGDLTFRTRSAGPEDGPPVLLLHGFPQTSRCWTAQLAALAEAGYRAVAFDQRGFSPGARPDDPTAYTLTHGVDDVVAVIDALGAEQVDLVGHDLGGAVAWGVAGHHPDRLRTVTVASSPHPLAFVHAYQARSDGGRSGGGSGGGAGGGSDQNERSGYIRAFREAPRGQTEEGLLANDAAALRAAYAGLPPEAIEAHVADMRQPGLLVAAVDWYRSMSARISAAVPPSPVPTLYVWSDADPSISRAAAEATVDFVTGPYQFVVLEGISHWIPEQAATPFAHLLLTHLATAG